VIMSVLITTLLLLVAAQSTTTQNANTCFSMGTDCYACKSVVCGWCVVGTASSGFFSGCNPITRESDCAATATQMSTSYTWNAACPLLTDAMTPATMLVSNGGGNPTGSPSVAATSSLGGGSNTNGGGTGASPTTALGQTGTQAQPGQSGQTGQTGQTGGGATTASAGNARCGASKKRSTAGCQTWGSVKNSLTGNNCAYDIGTSATSLWQDGDCVLVVPACIPPKGSSDQPNYQMCPDPVCAQTHTGWVCSSCYLVEDDGGMQMIAPGVPAIAGTPTGCAASNMRVGLLSALATLVSMALC